MFSDTLAVRPGFDLVVSCGGRLNRAVSAFLGLFARGGWELYHSGDPDPDGIAIPGDVHRICGAMRFRMDARTFDRYRDYGRILDTHVAARTALIDAGTLALPGIAGLVERIVRSGTGVEQEIIDYAEP